MPATWPLSPASCVRPEAAWPTDCLHVVAPAVAQVPILVASFHVASVNACSMHRCTALTPEEYNQSSSGVSTTGPYRAQFVIDAVANLRESLRAAGSDLIVRCGKPEEVYEHSRCWPH